MEARIRTIGGAQLEALLKKVIAEAIAPHAQQIVVAWFSGYVPLVVHEPSPGWQRLLNWKKNGRPAVVGLQRDEPAVSAMFQYPAERQWLHTQPTEDGPVHALLVHQLGSLCMVLDPARGWSIAPGTTDLELPLAG